VFNSSIEYSESQSTIICYSEGDREVKESLIIIRDFFSDNASYQTTSRQQRQSRLGMLVSSLLLVVLL